MISLASSISSVANDTQLVKQSDDDEQLTKFGTNVARSNDSGIHEDGLDNHLPMKSTQNSFQLPAWLANNQPIPDEILAKHSSVNNHSMYQFDFNDDDDDDDDCDENTNRTHPSSFYAFSFIDLSTENDDAWSINSVNTPNTLIGDQIKSCVESIHNCLSQIRQMNEQSQDIDEQIIDPSIADLVNHIIEQIEQTELNSNETHELILDSNLLNDLLTKKLTFTEYLNLLDELVDNKYVKQSNQTSEQLYNEIVSFADNIEQESTHRNECDEKPLNTRSNYSVLSFLQQSTSMDMSILGLNDFSSQIQSTINLQQLQTSMIDSKPADIGKRNHDFSKDLFV